MDFQGLCHTKGPLSKGPLASRGAPIRFSLPPPQGEGNQAGIHAGGLPRAAEMTDLRGLAEALDRVGLE
jgi:hypothetical protein